MQKYYVNSYELNEDELDTFHRFYPYVMHFDIPWKNKYPNFSDDFESGYLEALVFAIKTFDPNKKVNFKTYLVWKLMGCRSKIFKDIRKSINNGTSYDQNALYEIPDHREPTENIGVYLEGFLDKLHPRQREVIRGRFFYQETLEVIGKKIGVSKERTRQIETSALRKLRLLIRNRRNLPENIKESLKLYEVAS